MHRNCDNPNARNNTPICFSVKFLEHIRKTACIFNCKNWEENFVSHWRNAFEDLGNSKDCLEFLPLVNHPEDHPWRKLLWATKAVRLQPTSFVPWSSRPCWWRQQSCTTVILTAKMAVLLHDGVAYVQAHCWRDIHFLFLYHVLLEAPFSLPHCISYVGYGCVGIGAIEFQKRSLALACFGFRGRGYCSWYVFKGEHLIDLVLRCSWIGSQPI